MALRVTPQIVIGENVLEERFIQAYQMLGIDPALLSPAAGHA